MIDFSKIVQLVPDGGRLILTFTTRTDKKQNGDERAKEVSVVFAQQFKGRENDNDFSPFIVTGSVAELTDRFEPTIIGIARDQTRLAELKATTTTRVDQKKKQLSDAIQKHTKSPGKKDGELKEEKKLETKEEKQKPSIADLFSMSPASTAAAPEGDTAEQVPELEASEKEREGEVAHG